jgi:hypothetical protein
MALVVVASNDVVVQPKAMKLLHFIELHVCHSQYDVVFQVTLACLLAVSSATLTCSNSRVYLPPPSTLAGPSGTPSGLDSSGYTGKESAAQPLLMP